MTMIQTVSALTRRSSWLPLCIGLLAGILASAFLQVQHQQAILVEQDQHYGKALASLAARQAVDATLNHDLVSLQVILRDIAENPRIENATIHDVENRLLVQAGSTPNLNADPDALNFSAPITFHDSVAGYVTLSLESEDVSPLATSTISLGLCVLIALLIIALRDKQQSQSASASTQKNANTNKNGSTATTASGIPIANLKPMMEDLPARKHTVELCLYINNLATLRRQLSSPLLKQLLDALEQQIKGVCALYKGQLQPGSPSSNNLCIHFRNTDAATSSFNALCSAQLLQRLSAANGNIQLQLSATIAPHRDQASLMEHLNAHQLQQDRDTFLASQPAGSLLVTRSLSEQSNLQERIEAQPLTEQWSQIQQLQAPYADLLNKQFTQLKELHS